MTDRQDEHEQALRDRVRELERQLESQEDLQALIANLHTHQEELSAQQQTLVEAQRELEHSRDRYAELYDFAPIPILTLGSSGVIESMNLAGARLLGVDRALAVGMPLVIYVKDGSRRQFLDHMARCRRENGLVRTEIIVSGRGGNVVPVEIQCRRYDSLSEHGKVMAFQTVLIDQSDRIRHEEERRRSQDERDRIQREEVLTRAASEAKDRFLAVLSHELRTPLTPILLSLEGLAGREADAPGVRRGLAMIRRNTEVLTRLIDDLLDVTRIVHDKLHLVKLPVSLNSVLRAVVEMCASDLKQVGGPFQLELAAGEPYVLGDSLRLRQVFWNLLKNAIQHSPPDGRLSIRCEMAGSHSVQVSVSDSGAGIEPEEIERVFEPFQQLKQSNRSGSGLGLGLAICRGLVEAHGGTISVDSPGLDGGATFVVDLPSCPAPRVIADGEVRSSPLPHALQILLVEDHRDTAEAMQIVLRRLGYKVQLAASLAEARRLAEKPFDVLVSDLHLPDGSGLELMQELSARRRVRGIAMSGFGSEKDVRRSCEAGFHTHLVKPVDVAHVVDAIESLARS